MQKDCTDRVNLKKTPKPHHLHRMARPYEVFLYIFAVFPMIVMFCLMFFDSEGINTKGMTFVGLSNFLILTEKSTLVAFWNSLKYSVLTTGICIFFGYLVAYELYKSKFKNKYMILLLLVLPMWTNILLRINALAGVLDENNIFTSILNSIFYPEATEPVIKSPKILGTDLAIILGMVFTYLPFIVMPIYTSLEKIDPLLHEAAMDLGATETKKFWKVVVPMTSSGIVSGSIMVFLPCLSGFAIPKILGEGNIPLIGNIIEMDFINMSYNIGSVLAIVILVLILGSIILVNKFDKDGDSLI